MQIDWWTLGLQAINFLVLVWLLWRFLYRPVKRIIARREERAATARGELADAKKEAQQEKEKYEAAREDLAEERRELLKKVHSETAEEREKILKAARAEADEIIENAREQMAEERRRTREALKEEIADLAADMAGHLLRSASPETYNALLLNGICQRLGDMSREERERMRESLEDGDARLVVTTAAPLDDASQAEWADKLRQTTGSDVRVDFRSNEDLIGGAELKLPHAVMKFSWADQLERIKETINHRNQEPAA